MLVFTGSMASGRLAVNSNGTYVTDEFGARIKLEIEKWSEAVRNAKLRID